jgi:hypothetical protein
VRAHENNAHETINQLTRMVGLSASGDSKYSAGRTDSDCLIRHYVDGKTVASLQRYIAWSKIPHIDKPRGPFEIDMRWLFREKD